MLLKKVLLAIGVASAAASVALARDLYWEGTNGTWGVGLGGWKLSNGTPTVFEEGDNVTFNDADEETVQVMVEGNFAVGNFLIDANNEYIFSSVKRTKKVADLNGCITEATSFIKRGSGILNFDNFGGTWTCDMWIAEGDFKLNSASQSDVFQALAPQNTFFGDLSVERTVTIGSGDTSKVVTLKSAESLHYPTGSVTNEIVATFVFDAAKVLGSRSVINYPSMILKNGSILEACSTPWGNANNYLNGDIKVARRDDNQPAVGCEMKNSGYANYIRYTRSDPLVFDVDEVTSSDPMVDDEVKDLSIAWKLMDKSPSYGAYIKRGRGTLFLNNGANNFTGDVLVEEGTLLVASGALGDVKTNKTVTVVNGATLRFNDRQVLVGEGDTVAQQMTIVISNATLNVGGYNCLGNLKVYGNSQIISGKGYSNRGAYRLGAESYFETDDTFTLWTANGNAYNYLRLGYEKDKVIEVGEDDVERRLGKVEVCVQRAKQHSVDFADLVIAMPIHDTYKSKEGPYHSDPNRYCGILKTGPGILSITRENGYSYITDVKEGGLWLTGSVVSNVVVSLDAFVGGIGTINSNLEIKDGGGFLVDTTNQTARLTVDGMLTLPQAGLIKLYNVSETNVSKIHYENLPLPLAETYVGLDDVVDNDWRVEIDGMLPRETRHLKVLFDKENKLYSVYPTKLGLKVIVR